MLHPQSSFHLKNFSCPVLIGHPADGLPPVCKWPGANNSSCFGYPFHLLPCSEPTASRWVFKRAWVCVGIDQGFFAHLNDLFQSIRMGMGYIDHHSQLLHPLHNFSSGRSQPLVSEPWIEVPPHPHHISQFIVSIVNQGNHSDSHFIKFIHTIRPSLQRVTSFDRQNGSWRVGWSFTLWNIRISRPPSGLRRLVGHLP